LLGLARPLRKVLNRPIVCTLQGEDLFLDNLQDSYRRAAFDLIRRQISHVNTFIAVSEYYAEFMPGYLGIRREKIRVVPLGINLNGYERKTKRADQVFTIGYFARVAPEKGLHILAEAYRELRQEKSVETRLEVAGYLAPEHREYLAKIQRQMDQQGLGNEFRYHGILDRQQKIAFLQGLDVLSVPATYKEPKGVFLLEAMACGVPVVQPRHGAFTEIVEKTSGGLLVEPDNPRSLASGILKLIKEPGLTEELGRNGFDGVREYYSVARSADQLIDVYESVIDGGVGHRVMQPAKQARGISLGREPQGGID
jgi:glycosyltransferase involved in cell wall biosynthesis